MKKLFVAFLLIIPFCLAQWQYDSEQVNVNLKTTGSFTVIQTGSHANLEYLYANMSFVPSEDYRQHILATDTEPMAEISDSALFTWNKPDPGKHSYYIDTRIMLRNAQKKITSKIPFPFSAPDEVKQYTKATQTIDSDDASVVEMANKLAQGEDDLFIVLYRLASWTRENVEYNLSTVTASVSEKASWVLENKQGVCDEITNLFIAMARSLGIPARFVSGIAYTDSELFTERWGPHGWAEVYFPGYGWVEYDVTYGQIGFVDPTHITLKRALDPNEASVKYNWFGRDIDVETKALQFKTDLLGHSGIHADELDVETFPERDEIGFDSYTIINVRVKNKGEHYRAEQILLSRTEGVIDDTDLAKDIVLKPGEEKIIPFLVHLGKLEKGYQYTFPISVAVRGSNASSEFEANERGAYFGKEEMSQLLAAREELESKTYSKEVSMTCGVLKEKMMINEQNTATCTLTNKGNIPLALNVCFKECASVQLGISQEKEVSFSFTENIPGNIEKDIIAKSNEAVSTAKIVYAAYDAPSLEIRNLSYPESVAFNDAFTIQFNLVKTSFAPAEDIEITLSQGDYTRTWAAEELNDERKFVLNLKGSELLDEQSKLELHVSFSDRNEGKHDIWQDITINLSGLSITERILLFLNKLGRWIATPFGIIASIVGILSIILFSMTRKFK